MVDDVVMIQIMVNHWLLIIDFTKKNENDDLQVGIRDIKITCYT